MRGVPRFRTFVPINSGCLPFDELFETGKIFARYLSKRRRLEGRPYLYRHLRFPLSEGLEQYDTLRKLAAACLPSYSALWNSEYNLQDDSPLFAPLKGS